MAPKARDRERAIVLSAALLLCLLLIVLSVLPHLSTREKQVSGRFALILN